jgi:hypothetical protein
MTTVLNAQTSSAAEMGDLAQRKVPFAASGVDFVRGRRGKGLSVPFRDAPAVVALYYNYVASPRREFLL